MSFNLQLSKLDSKVKSITLLVIYAIVVFFFLINAESIFPNWNSSWSYSTLIYLVGVSLFLSIREKIPNQLKKPVADSIFGFAVGFPLFIVGFHILKYYGVLFTGVTELPVYLIIPTMVYQIGVVATSEEIIFRGTIFSLLYQINPTIGYLVSSVIFAGFHWGAYGGDLNLLFVVFLLGIVLCYCTEKHSIGVAIAFHSAWNCMVLGAVYLL